MINKIKKEIETWESSPEHIKKAILRMAFGRKFSVVNGGIERVRN